MIWRSRVPRMLLWLVLALDSLVSLAVFPFVWRVWRGFRGVDVVARRVDPMGTEIPKVAIIVPARNEERSIEACVRSLLAQNYPRDRMGVWVLNDRSVDATSEILSRVASEEDRLVVLVGSELPAGWQGKCWAIHQAVSQLPEDLEFYLFTDADTVHDSTMLESAVYFARTVKADLLSLAPAQELGSYSERMLLPGIFAVIMTSQGTVVDVNDVEQPEVAKAIGQFMLFEATAYRRLGGHAAVRSDIVEDFALARLAKARGQKIFLADGRYLVRTRMYRSVREIWEGFGKNAFDEAQKQPGGALAGLTMLPLAIVIPYFALIMGFRRLSRGASPLAAVTYVQGAAQVAAIHGVGCAAAKFSGTRSVYGHAFSLSGLFLWAILANSTWRKLSGRGVTWKGRRYA